MVSSIWYQLFPFKEKSKEQPAGWLAQQIRVADHVGKGNCLVFYANKLKFEGIEPEFWIHLRRKLVTMIVHMDKVDMGHASAECEEGEKSIRRTEELRF